MKNNYRLILAVSYVFIIFCSNQVKANDEIKFNAQNKQTKWTMSAGLINRGIKVENQFKAVPIPENKLLSVTVPNSLGQLGLFTSGSEPINYQDGSVSNTIFDGTTNPDHQNISDYSKGDRINFNSTRYTSSENDSLYNLGVKKDDDRNNMPFIQTSYLLNEKNNSNLQLVGRYGEMATNFSVAPIASAERVVTITETKYSYTYQIDPIFGNNWVVFDADLFNSTWDSDLGVNPSESRRSSNNHTRFERRSSVDFNVDFSEILLGLQWNLHKERYSFNFLAGPTLNIASWDLKNTNQWFRDDSNSAVIEVTSSSSERESIWGASAEVSMRIYLGQKNDLFFDLGAGYAWVDNVTAQNDLGKVELDLSSYFVRTALGVNF